MTRQTRRNSPEDAGWSLIVSSPVLFFISLVGGDGSKGCDIQNVFVVECCESEIAVVSDVMTHKEHDCYGVFCSSYWKKKSLDYWLLGPTCHTECIQTITDSRELSSPACLSEWHNLNLLLSPHRDGCDWHGLCWCVICLGLCNWGFLVHLPWNRLVNWVSDLLPQQLPDSIMTQMACWQRHSRSATAPKHSKRSPCCHVFFIQSLH